MTGTRKLGGVVALCGLILLPSGVGAQTPAPLMGSGVSWETYRFSSPRAIGVDNVWLLSVPLAGRLQFGRFAFTASGAWASGRLEFEDGTSATLSGPTDTELSVQLELGRGTGMITGIVSLPTGRESLTADEMLVAGAVAADVLPFRIASWGTGGGAGLGFAVARPIGGFAAGVSAAYIVARTYQPLEADQFEYRPGDQLQLRFAIDRVIGYSTKVAFQLSYQNFGTDDGDGRNLFQTGDRIQAIGSLDFAVGSAAAIVYTGYLNRNEGEFDEPQAIVPAQNLVFAGGGLRIPIGRTVLQPTAELRLLDGGDEAEGHTLGIGTTLDFPVGTWTAAPTLRARFGELRIGDTGTSGFTGAEIGLTLRHGRVR